MVKMLVGLVVVLVVYFLYKLGRFRDVERGIFRKGINHGQDV